MIRLILIIIFLLFFLTIGQISLIIGLIISIFDKKLSQFYYMKIVQMVFKIILFLAGTKIVIKGENNIEKYLNDENAKLIVSNHRSFFDIVSGFIILKNRTGYVSKVELKKVPIVSFWMKKINCIFIDRDNIKEAMKSIIASINNIKSGISVWIFPEGTRNKNENNNELLEFKEGSFSIAKKTNCMVLPIAFVNTDSIFEKNNLRIKKTEIKIILGEGFFIDALSDEYKERVGLYSMNVIKEMINEGV